MQGTVALVRSALLAAGRRLDPAVVPYQPSEPPSFAGVPRAVLRTDVADQEQGFVVVYEASGAARAEALGRELAAHVGSGFGQTNYPLDAQFALSQVGPTVVFHWWSPDRVEDRDRAQGAFDVISRFGQPIEVRK
jgi:hypothetical protein